MSENISTSTIPAGTTGSDDPSGPAAQPAAESSAEATTPSDSPSGSRRLTRWIWIGLPLLLAGGAAATGMAFWDGGSASLLVDAEGRTQVIRRMDMDITVKQTGELAAVRNVEVRNEVHGRRTITYLIPEGMRVDKGDTLALLDPEDLANEIERLELDLTEAEVRVNDEREELEWQLTQNAADLESAEVSLSLAEMELSKYVNGEWPKKLGEAQSKLSAAETTLETRQEDLQTSLSLFSRGFVTAKKVKADRQAVMDADRDVQSARIALEVLEEYEHPMSLQSKKDSLRQAQNKVERTKVRGRSAEANRRTRLARAEEHLKRVQDHLEFKKEQLALCTITAPEAGLVVYHDDGRNDIAEGEPSHHRQTLMLLPDTEQMKAVVRIPENRVPLLKTGMMALINKPVEGFHPLSATVEKISVLAESNGRWYDRESREYPVDLVLNETPEGLKPGLKIEATVFVERMRDVVAVPLSCVYNQAGESFVFVKTADELGVEPRKIDVGRANETHAQVMSGLADGDQVIELGVGEGRTLLERFGLANPLHEKPVMPVLEPEGDTMTADTSAKPLAGQ